MKIGLQYLIDKDLYRTYLERLDARALLEYYGARNCSELTEGDGTTGIVHSCLLNAVEPHHSHGDENPSAYCNLDKKVYVCYAMGFGCDLFHLVMKLEGKETFSESLTLIGEFLTGAVQETGSFVTKLQEVIASTGTTPYQVNLPTYSERIIDGWANLHPYWAERGINDSAADTLRLGYDPQENRIVFPHFVKGKLVGWQKRVIPDGWGWRGTVPTYPKYRNSSGFPKSETLYNLDAAKAHPRVCVVESPMSVARAVSLGIPNVVATFGAKVSQLQINELAKFDTVYIWFDRDVAGAAGEAKLALGLYQHTETLVVPPDGGRDMGDLNLEQIAEKLGQAVPAAVRIRYDPRRKRADHPDQSRTG